MFTQIFANIPLIPLSIELKVHSESKGFITSVYPAFCKATFGLLLPSKASANRHFGVLDGDSKGAL